AVDLVGRGLQVRLGTQIVKGNMERVAERFDRQDILEVHAALEGQVGGAGNVDLQLDVKVEINGAGTYMKIFHLLKDGADAVKRDHTVLAGVDCQTCVLHTLFRNTAETFDGAVDGHVGAQVVFHLDRVNDRPAIVDGRAIDEDEASGRIEGDGRVVRENAAARLRGVVTKRYAARIG